jgi:HK97 family phage major capsid protein
MSDQARLTELQSALRAKMADNKAIADSFRVEDGTVVVSTQQKSAFDKNMSDIKEIKSLIEGVEAMNTIEQWGSQAPTESVAVAAAAGYSVKGLGRNTSIGDLFLASTEFKSLQNGKNGANMVSPFQIQASLTTGMRFKDVFSDLPGGVGSGTMGHGADAIFGGVQRDPMVMPPQRIKRVRDLFPARTTTAAVIEYFRMLGFTMPGGGVNNAGTVPERNAAGSAFGSKPQSSMVFEGHQAPVRTIAHWEAAHRNVLADEPQLRSIIDNELMYGLRLQEDAQILNGDGQGENLTGVLQTSGIQNYAWSSGAYGGASFPGKTDSKADAIRRAATLAFLAYYEPSGVVMHPNDWEDIELTKDGNGQYLVAVSVAMGGEPKVWRLPIVETPAIPEGTALVGAFGTGAQLYDREQANIRISEQHADFFVRNAIVVLAEQRLALAVKRPESFVKVTFDAAPSA